jgi:hypothetical protein
LKYHSIKAKTPTRIRRFLTLLFHFAAPISFLFLGKETINVVVNKINFATKIYRLSPLEKGGNEVNSREFFGYF